MHLHAHAHASSVGACLSVCLLFLSVGLSICLTDDSPAWSPVAAGMASGLWLAAGEQASGRAESELAATAAEPARAVASVAVGLPQRRGRG